MEDPGLDSLMDGAVMGGGKKGKNRKKGGNKGGGQELKVGFF